MTIARSHHNWEEDCSQQKKVKIVKQYREYGCGFPVLLLNVPVREDEGEWIPDVRYDKLDKFILLELCRMSHRLTGNQIRFIRLYFEKTLQEFSKIFKIQHSTVIHWEKQKNKAANLNWGTELAIRLFVLYRLEPNAKKFQRDYALLLEGKIKDTAQRLLEIDLRELD
jgi:hypothetical protein